MPGQTGKHPTAILDSGAALEEGGIHTPCWLGAPYAAEVEEVTLTLLLAGRVVPLPSAWALSHEALTAGWTPISGYEQ